MFELARVIIGDVIILAGLVAVGIGLLGILRFRSFDLRLLAASKVDTVGLLLFLVGVMVRSGFTWFSAKALLIAALVVLANPVVTAQLAARQREDRLNRSEPRMIQERAESAEVVSTGAVPKPVEDD